MKVDKTTAWYNKDSVPKEMVKGAQGELWPTLENADHFPALKELLDSVPAEDKIMIELGCGAGDVGRVFKDYYYTGADLAHIIEKVARVVNPTQNYMDFDIYEDTTQFLEDYPVVVMSAFIDVLEYPLECLDKILQNAPKYVVLHRQAFNDTETVAVETTSYDLKKTYLSFIAEQGMIDLLAQRDFQIVKTLMVGDKCSLLLKNDKI